MARIPLNPPPGLTTGDTAFSAKNGVAYYTLRAGWVDMDKARFWRERPQTIGGWENFIGMTLTGVCRNLCPWSDNSGVLNVAFGTHSNLEVFAGGALSDITTTLALPSLTLGASPIATTNTSSTVVVTQVGHPYIVGDSVIISGASAVATVTINGTWTVSAVTTNTWSFVAGSSANATTTGGGSAVVVTPQRAFAAGNIDGTGGAGWGTGSYSVGNFSQPSTAAFYPRTWSLTPYGQSLMANPRGGCIYQWNNNTGTPAAPLANSPSQVTAMLVTPQRQVVALGCNQQIDGVFNPLCIRGSDIEGPTTWNVLSSNNAWEQHLEGGGRIVHGAVLGDYLFIWTDTALWQGQFIGDPGQTYRFTKLGEHCGLMGPNAKAILGQTAYWMSPDGNFRSCALNGEPQLIVSPIQADVSANIASGQQDKIVASVIPQFDEVWWFYPDARDGTEVSRYVGLSTVAGSGISPPWLHGTFVRTAFDEGAPMAYPIGVDLSGNVYLHEKGQSADGGVLTWFYETAAQTLGEGDQRYQIKGFWPDIQGQVGPVSVTIYARDYPQGSDRVKGPYAIAPGRSKRDMLADCRTARVRFAGSAAPTFGRLGTFEFDTEPTGLQ